MNLHLTANRLAPSRSPTRRDSRFDRGRALVRTWLQRGRERRMLLELDDFMLKDIGLTRADVVVESGKHFWEP